MCGAPRHNQPKANPDTATVWSGRLTHGMAANFLRQLLPASARTTDAGRQSKDRAQSHTALRVLLEPACASLFWDLLTEREQQAFRLTCHDAACTSRLLLSHLHLGAEATPARLMRIAHQYMRLTHLSLEATWGAFGAQNRPCFLSLKHLTLSGACPSDLLEQRPCMSGDACAGMCALVCTLPDACPLLHALHLVQCTVVHSRGVLAQLAGCQQLRELRLEDVRLDCTLEDAGLESLVALTLLQLTGCTAAAAAEEPMEMFETRAVEPVCLLPRLSTLGLAHVPRAVQVGQLSSLTALDVSESPTAPSHSALAALAAAMPGLSSLALPELPCHGAAHMRGAASDVMPFCCLRELRVSHARALPLRALLCVVGQVHALRVLEPSALDVTCELGDWGDVSAALRALFEGPLAAIIARGAGGDAGECGSSTCCEMGCGRVCAHTRGVTLSGEAASGMMPLGRVVSEHAPALSRAVCLGVAHTSLGADDVRALAHSCCRLACLSLEGCELRGGALDGLSGMHALTRLILTRCTGTAVGYAGALAFALRGRAYCTAPLVLVLDAASLGSMRTDVDGLRRVLRDAGAVQVTVRQEERTGRGRSGAPAGGGSARDGARGGHVKKELDMRASHGLRLMEVKKRGLSLLSKKKLFMTNEMWREGAGARHVSK